MLLLIVVSMTSAELRVTLHNGVSSSTQLSSTSVRSSTTEGLLISDSLMKSNTYEVGFMMNDDGFLSRSSTTNDSLELIEIEVRELSESIETWLAL